ncbi:MAG: hypothetical protein EBS49_02165 [Verrucomicrobia bacterium]|nr:hypothetical protein [Verrucomicrobiota bacterium]
MYWKVDVQAKIITLLGNAHSEQVSRECVEQAAKFGINVEIFSAIYGTDRKSHLNKLGLRPFPNYKMKVGAYGCMLSHYYLYQYCLEIDEPLLVLEHDGYLMEPLEPWLLDQFEDVLKLDIYSPYQEKYNTNIDNSKSVELTIRHDISGIHKKSSYGWYSWGAYAYILKPSGARKILDKIHTTGYMKADLMLGTNVLTVSIPSRPLARLHPMYNSQNIDALSLTHNLR